MVRSACAKFKNALTALMRELHMPYDIDALTKIRHECFRRNMENQANGQQPMFKQPPPDLLLQQTKRGKRNGKGRPPRGRTPYPKTVSTRSTSIRTRSGNASATITQETTYVELQKPRFIQIPQNEYQFATVSSTSSGSPMSTNSTPELIIASPVESPDFQSISEPIAISSTTSSETGVIYEFDCAQINNSTPCYVITSNEPITFELGPSELVPVADPPLVVEAEYFDPSQVCF